MLFKTRIYYPNLLNKMHLDVFVGLGVNFLHAFEINNLRVFTNEKPGFDPVIQTGARLLLQLISLKLRLLFVSLI